MRFWVVGSDAGERNEHRIIALGEHRQEAARY